MTIDLNRLHQDWNEQRDPERAVVDARRLMESIRDGQLDPVSRLGALEVAAEPLWDAEGGDPTLVLSAVEASQRAFRVAERFGGLRDPARLYMRGRPMVLLARSQHRAERPRDGFLTSLDLLCWLSDFVGGRPALLDVIGRPTANPVAELTVAALGIYPAALRRAGLPFTLREQYTRHGLELVVAYISQRAPVIYSRTAALASQWMFLLVERNNAEDAPLVERLQELDARSRPRHVRGQATQALRELEYARYLGDLDDLERHRRAAVADLDRHHLVRHQRVIETQGYLAA